MEKKAKITIVLSQPPNNKPSKHRTFTVHVGGMFVSRAGRGYSWAEVVSKCASQCC